MDSVPDREPDLAPPPPHDSSPGDARTTPDPGHVVGAPRQAVIGAAPAVAAVDAAASPRAHLGPAGAPRLAVPAALFSPRRQPDFRVYGDLGEPVILGPRRVEDATGETVYLDRADAGDFRAYLRGSLRSILENQRISAADRGWAAHRALLHEVALLYSEPAARARATALIMVARDLASLILSHGNPDALFSSVRGDTPYSPVVHAMETAIGAISLAIADGQRGPNFLAMLGTGGVFADIGLLDIPDEVRDRTRPLTLTGVEAVHRHPETSAGRMRALGIVAEVALNAAIAHHERWDGSGYPAGLAGEAIPIEARYVAVADAYSSLTATRPGVPRLSRVEALDRIAGATGQFDPAVVRALLSLLAPHRTSTAGARSAAPPAAGGEAAGG